MAGGWQERKTAGRQGPDHTGPSREESGFILSAVGSHRRVLAVEERDPPLTLAAAWRKDWSRTNLVTETVVRRLLQTRP